MPDALQRIAGWVLLIASSPLQAVLALLVRIDSPGPALYRAKRMGAGGSEFVLYKLRTMAAHRSGADPAISRKHDPRVTRMGRLLRATRLDELPQLWNVARGEMRLVGPRPEDPRFVDLADPVHREVFTARPGIAGLTQLVFADEGRLLDGVADPDATYRDDILPRKVRIDAAYLHNRSPSLDLWILAQTPLALLGRQVTLPTRLARELAGAVSTGEAGSGHAVSGHAASSEAASSQPTHARAAGENSAQPSLAPRPKETVDG